MLEEYKKHITERTALGVAPQPLTAAQVAALVEVLKANAPSYDGFDQQALLDLLIHRIPAGVDEAAALKAEFLAAVAMGQTVSPLVSPETATELLGTMQGGYNVAPLIALLDSEKLGAIAAQGLSHTLLVFDALHDVVEKVCEGNAHAQTVLQSWADAEWFTRRPKLAEKLTVTVFKVAGETNTDDLSPAQDAWSRPDIPLHAQSMLKVPRDGITDAGAQIRALKDKGFPVAYVGDVVGTGSSRKSATNSVLWHTGADIPFVPNKRAGGVCIGGKIAPIFFNTLEDSGALPIECDVAALQMGDIIDIYPYEGIIRRHDSNQEICRFSLKTGIIPDEVRAGGRIALIIGRGLTDRARAALSLGPSTVFVRPQAEAEALGIGYTLAQKIVGKACGVEGVHPGAYCEPRMTTVGSQDTTGPMTRDELKDLACLGFSADLVMQSFCHTSAYPKPVDVKTHHTLPAFIMDRGGVSLRPGDGIIHSWLNRMLLPDTVGTGGDSHTRFPLGISFPAGSGLVAFAAATGVMPLDMPESVLVRFTGSMQPGITLRDLVHAIPYAALQRGLLTVEKKAKTNVFSGRILEIEGLPDLKVEQAFELADASAERSAAACTIKLNKAPVEEYLRSNIVLLRWMIAEGYGDARTLQRRIAAMSAWLENPVLLEADENAEYAEILEIDLDQIREPLLCCPNDPDDVKPLSAVAGTAIDEVFLGSCMTNIGHFRAAGRLLEKFGKAIPSHLWVAPPTRMDQAQLIEEGVYSSFGKAGARTEMPGCSLCMGNQARVADNAVVVSTSTRNFPNRLGAGASVFLASAELAAICSILGRIPDVAAYMSYVQDLADAAESTYRYLNFDKMPEFVARAAEAA
ncbi:bifunctional aconitate hydratase 2/2-methylisocitrate dehydratase [Candidatus Methylospira mobilis]|uniref:bifunctional aconitate hydratase 2/2-methylisocitrate dehydratase n=1 Tax=Candidatus Methylospira mobilis TaxID=1808979 RepID=UPI0028E54F78|nr:bifunctional aconitate hydratase 2/2-methylisocitrate dehydratase [Candidatus Methylospira mobilis]WNV03815.1 bifunctional aconitate hydratase 2/2-methylisocitrate dehydratase [Candidatus Methylospira mobilis]